MRTMYNNLWADIADYLKGIRCSDRMGHSCIELESCRKAQDELERITEVYEKMMAELGDSRIKPVIEDFISAIQHESFEEEQRAYYQGFIDCLQVLGGLGLVKADEHIQEMIHKLSN